MAIRGSRSGVGGTKRTCPSDKEIYGIIVAEVSITIRVVILELFGSFKTMLIEEFDECYAASCRLSPPQPLQLSPLHDLRGVGRCSTGSSLIRRLQSLEMKRSQLSLSYVYLTWRDPSTRVRVSKTKK